MLIDLKRMISGTAIMYEDNDNIYLNLKST